MSFPPATEMFQFAGFASRTYGFSTGYPSLGGLPHSEIPGSTIARISPGLFAACHVLHRLSVPRHPPDALHLRLSATPNGKCHEPRTRPGRRQPPGASRGPSIGAANLPLRRHFVAGSRTPPQDKPARTCPTAARGLPLRSHNSLLYDVTATTRPGLPERDGPRQFRSSRRVSCCARRRRPSEFAAQTPAGATGHGPRDES